MRNWMERIQSGCCKGDDAMVDVVLLGCGGGMPMPERFLSAFLMNYKGRKILIDCGEGTQVAMKMVGWGFKSIDVICITHGHGDHTVGLPGLLATIGNSGRTEPLTIMGPEGIENIVNGLRVIAPYLPYEVNIIENPEKPVILSVDSRGARVVEQGELSKGMSEDIVISTLELDHSAPCMGYGFYIRRRPKFDVEKAMKNEVPKVLWSKLQKGEAITYEGSTYEPHMVLGTGRRGIKLSYVTDTRPTDAIPDFIRESDLFICEGTYGSDEDLEKAVKNKHMTFREAAELASKGQARELLLTHFSPAMGDPEAFKDNATVIFENTIIGCDRLVKTIGFSDQDH